MELVSNVTPLADVYELSGSRAVEYVNVLSVLEVTIFVPVTGSLITVK